MSVWTTWIVGLLACSGGGGAEAPEPEVPEQCRNVHVDKLAIDWLAVRGKAADPKTRFRIEESAGGYDGVYIGGFFTKYAMKGEKRDKDVKFTEVPVGKRKEDYEAGTGSIVVAYLKPSLKDCAVQAFIGTVDKKGKEEVPPRGIELVPFPKQDGVEFTYAVADEPLFLGDAAKDAGVRDKQVEELGGPQPDHEMGTVPVGTFTSVEDDGDPACTYDMDLYFDHQKVTELSPKAAAEPVDGQRHWFHEWEAPFSGNHHFEIHRYRTCGDGNRERIGVAAVEAVLM